MQFKLIVQKIFYLFLFISVVSCGENADESISNNVNPKNPSSEAASLQAPASLTLSSNSGINTRPVVSVGGVEVGSVVKIYTDSSCVTQIGLNSANASSVDVQISTLSVGAHTFYAKAFLDGKESACSTANASYTVNACPEGYVAIAFDTNTELGIGDFCVMKYEAGEENANIVSKSSVTPKVNVTPTQTKSLCTGIDNGAGKYDLISNLEWMAIARDLEKVKENWSGGEVGSGCLHQGNIGSNVAGCAFNAGQALTVDERSQSQKDLSGHLLTSGDVIFDLSGNIGEYVDYTLGGEMDYFENSCPSSWESLFDNGCNTLDTSHYLPGQTYASTDSKIYGLGRIINYPQGVISRGGSYSYGLNGQAALESVGVFLMSTNDSLGRGYTSVGFRCVYRP